MLKILIIISVIVFIAYNITEVRKPKNLGKVVKGNGLAKKLNFPTINIELKGAKKPSLYRVETNIGKGIMIVDCTGLYAEINLDYYFFYKSWVKEVKIYHSEEVKPKRVIKEGLWGVLQRGFNNC